MENGENYDKNLLKMVKLTLLRCGIKCDHSGFEYLLACIMATIKNPQFLSRSGPMFCLVAKEFGVSDPARIKGNIHNAILHTYKTHGFDYINQLYGMNVLKSDYKPSPVEFIRLIVEYFTLGLYKKQFPDETA